MDLTGLLADCDDHVRKELSCMPDVDDVTAFDPTTDSPPIAARRWLRVTDAVAVVADLKSSTKLGLGKYAQSTASIYEAALHPVVDIFHEFGAGWIPIQGDCVIGLFWDEAAMERAMCAGITVKTFSAMHLVERLTRGTLRRASGTTTTSTSSTTTTPSAAAVASPRHGARSAARPSATQSSTASRAGPPLSRTARSSSCRPSGKRSSSSERSSARTTVTYDAPGPAPRRISSLQAPA